MNEVLAFLDEMERNDPEFKRLCLEERKHLQKLLAMARKGQRTPHEMGEEAAR